MSPTTQFDRLCTRALKLLYPEGASHFRFRADPGSDCYQRSVKPDFVLPDGRWIDFKYRVSFRESHSVAWRPSALYASLRKYVDHSANPTQSLLILYGSLHGSIDDIEFPITRGRKILIRDAADFASRIQFVDVRRLYDRITAAGGDDVVVALRSLEGLRSESEV